VNFLFNPFLRPYVATPFFQDTVSLPLTPHRIGLAKTGDSERAGSRERHQFRRVY
jgi:hypothetical protein